MEQKRQKALDMIERMKLQASDNIEKGLELYIMHATCAVEFADLLTELLTTEATSAPKAEIPADANIRVRVDVINKREDRTYVTRMFFLVINHFNYNKMILHFSSVDPTKLDAYKIYVALLESAADLDEDGIFKKLYEQGLKEGFFQKKIDLTATEWGADHD